MLQHILLPLLGLSLALAAPAWGQSSDIVREKFKEYEKAGQIGQVSSSPRTSDQLQTPATSSKPSAPRKTSTPPAHDNNSALTSTASPAQYQQPASYRPSSYPVQQPLRIPDLQLRFTQEVEAFIPLYKQAPNELVKTDLRRQRRTRLSQILPNLSISGWVARIHSMRTDSNGLAYIALRLPNSCITIHSTPISGDSSLYKLFSQLKSGPEDGDLVEFSGFFKPSSEDYLKEISWTESGSMIEPEFLLQISDVRKLSP